MESGFLDLYTLKMFQEKLLNKNQIENYPAFTTFKYRDEGGYVKRTIDYMFFADNNFPQNQIILEALMDTADLEKNKQID